MKTEDLMNALTDQDLALIADAEPGKQKKRRRRILYVVLIAAVVAVLASVLTVTVFAQNKEPEQPDPAPVGESESEQTSEQENITATEKTIEPASGQTEKTPTPTEPTGAESEEPSASASEVTPTLTPSETPTPQPTSDTPAVNTPYDDYTIPIDDKMNDSVGLPPIPNCLYRSFALLKVTKKINSEDSVKKIHFKYSENYSGNCPETRVEYCTEIEYEVIFASHIECSVSYYSETGKKKSKGESVAQLLHEKTPVFIPNSFIDSVSEGDVLFCELYFRNEYTNNPNYNHIYYCFVAAGHDSFGWLNKPGAEIQWYGESGLLCKAVDGKIDSSCSWWEASIGESPLLDMRCWIESFKNTENEKLRNSELYKHLPDLSLDDGMTFEEIDSVYTWIWQVYHTLGKDVFDTGEFHYM